MLRTFEHNVGSEEHYRFGWLPNTRSKHSDTPPGIVYRYEADGHASLDLAKKYLPSIHDLQCSSMPGSDSSNAQIVSDALSLISAHMPTNRIPRIVTLELDDATKNDYCSIATGKDNKLSLFMYGHDGNGFGGLVLSSRNTSPCLSQVLQAHSLWGSSSPPQAGLFTKLRRVSIDVTMDEKATTLPSAPLTQSKSRLREVTFRLKEPAWNDNDGNGEQAVSMTAEDIAKAFNTVTTRYPRLVFTPHPESNSLAMTEFCHNLTRQVSTRRSANRQKQRPR